MSKWIRLTHRIATYGQPPETRALTLGQWDRHLLDARAAGDKKTSSVPSVLGSSLAYVMRRIWDGPQTVLPLGGLLFLGALAEAVLAVNDGYDYDFVQFLLAAALGCVGLLLMAEPQSFHPKPLTAAMIVLGVSSAILAPGLPSGRPVENMIQLGFMLLAMGALAAGFILLVNLNKEIPHWWYYPLRLSGGGSLAIGVANSLQASSDLPITTAIGTLAAALAGLCGIAAVERFRLLPTTQDRRDSSIR